MLSAGILSHAIVVIVTILLTSGIWLTAYFAGVKPQKGTVNNFVGCNATTCPDSPPLPKCGNQCEFVICESIPWGLEFDPKYPIFNKTTDCWMRLMAEAQNEVVIGSYYWSLLVNDTGDGFTYDKSNSSADGKLIYDTIAATANRGVNFRISQAYQNGGYAETADLQKNSNGKINVRTLDFTKWYGAGILHTKSWAVDGKHFYVGSANFDWRSLTQVKEMGIAAFNCPCMANDMTRILDLYWEMGAPNAVIPNQFPAYLGTPANHQNPTSIPLPEGNQAMYFSVSPPGFQACGREDDLTAMIKAIDEAQSFIYLAVMDYSLASLYLGYKNYWDSKLDESIRRAAFDRGVEIRFMMSRWINTRPAFYTYLHSLNDLSPQLKCLSTKNQTCVKKGSISVKIVEVPKMEYADIPYCRVYHNKYFVTDTTAYVGTSNWSPDYWTDTAGIGLIIRSDDNNVHSYLVSNLQKVFERDWFSNYTLPISSYDLNGNLLNNTIV